MKGKDSAAVVFRRRRSSQALTAAAWVLALGAVSCDAVSPVCRSGRCAERVDVYPLTSWGVSNRDDGPAQPLADEAEENHGALVHVIPFNTKPDLMNVVEASLMGKMDELATLVDPTNWPEDNEFDAFLANGGGDVLRWTPCGSAGVDRLVRLDERYRDDQLRHRFDPSVLTGVECCPSGGDCSDGGLYAVPVGLHQVNHIVYNPARFEGCDLEGVADVAGFVGLLECLSQGDEVVISVPTDSPECGRSVQYLIENLFLLVAGADGYQKYWRGEGWGEAGAPSAPEGRSLRAELDELIQQVEPYLNGCGTSAGCSVPDTLHDAADAVGTGDAAFMVIPDWFAGEARQRSGGRVRGATFPGTGPAFLFATDVFAIPSHDDVEAGLRWVDALLDPDAQRDFARDKGARPALDPMTPDDIPSLEALLPASLDIETLRGTLDGWMRAGFPADPPLFERIDQQFADGEGHVVSCSAARCEGSCGGL